MPEWKGKTRGGVWGHKIFVFVVKHFGLGAGYLLLKFVALYFVIFSNKKYIYHFYSGILKNNFLASLKSIYRNYCKLGEILIDKVALLSGFGANFTYNFDGEEYLREMTDGGILLSAHLGSWEIAGQLLHRLDTVFNIVMYDAEHKNIKNYLDGIMSKKNFKIITIKDDLSHIYEITNALANKELVCLHADRFVEGTKTIPAEFLGHKAMFPAGPFALISKLKVPVSFVFAFKETKKHYHFFATKAKFYDFSDKFKDRANNINLILNDYLAELEAKVRLFPVQWFNYHKFWETT